MNPHILTSVITSLLLTSLITPVSVYAQALETASPVSNTTQTTNPKSQLENVVEPQLCLPVSWLRCL
ncbi:MAG: hypothetical protein VKJ02_15555 [Snowella sp.]|nr:hypothetical protein [Snowella sp.]